jgi:hypothetical protein
MPMSEYRRAHDSRPSRLVDEVDAAFRIDQEPPYEGGGLIVVGRDQSVRQVVTVPCALGRTATHRGDVRVSRGERADLPMRVPPGSRGWRAPRTWTSIGG